MHLGVNLRAAQVKALVKFTFTDATYHIMEKKANKTSCLAVVVYLKVLNLTMKNLRVHLHAATL